MDWKRKLTHDDTLEIKLKVQRTLYFEKEIRIANKKAIQRLIDDLYLNGVVFPTPSKEVECIDDWM